MITLKGLEGAKKFVYERGSFAVSEQVSDTVMHRIKDLFGYAMTPYEAVANIIKEVRIQGDEAVRKFSYLIDGVSLDTVEVSMSDLKAARDLAPRDLVAALEFSAQRVHDFAL